jgi:hypothetical protein
MILRRVLLSLALALATSPCCLSAAPDTPPILVADVTQSDPAHHLLAASLQGLANRSPDSPRVFLLTNPRDAEWLDYCLRLLPRETETVTLDQLFEALKADIEGQIIYDPTLPYTLDIATTAAGLHDAVITPTDLGVPTLLDLRGRWSSTAEAYRWAVETLLPECSRTHAALISGDIICLRDFAIQQRAFTFSPPLSAQDPVFQDILLHLPPGTAIYGQTPAALLQAVSRASHYFVPAAGAANLSFLSRLADDRQFHQYIGYLDPTAPRYLTLIFDCSDLSFAINHMPALWDHPVRGTLPLGWALPASLADAAPPVLHRYYADAYRSGLDQFVLGPSGAGEMDISRATAPYSFYRATARACAALDAGTLLYVAPRDPAALGPSLARFAADTQCRGAFVLGAPDLAPLLHNEIPALGVARVDSVEAAVAYLNRLLLERRFAALLLDPRSLTPADARQIAGHVGNRYAVVGPEEMIGLMARLSPVSQPGPAAVAVKSVDYPDPAAADLSLPVKAVIEPHQAVASASVVYGRTGSFLYFSEPMSLRTNGYWASLPPLLCGGEFSFRIRAADRAGRVVWSPTWALQIPRADADGDGLSDPEESLLLTAPDMADTDGDGLIDGNDPSPLRRDRVLSTYVGPVYPPSDLPYLPDPGGSSTDRDGRYLKPGQTCLYWFPLTRLPPRAPGVIALDARGPATLSPSSDPSSFMEQCSGELTDAWYSPPFLSATHPGGAFLRIACPPQAQRPLHIRGLAILSPPGAPSIAKSALQPAYPGPRQPITVSTLVFASRPLSRVALTYRVNSQGEITIPMQQSDGSQHYRARIPALDNNDQLEWWITATDADGNQSATAVTFLPIGGRSREVVSLLAARDFLGDWSPASDWDGAGRLALSPGLRDSASVNLTGGRYTVWVLAGGRGHSIAVGVGDRRVGGIDPLGLDAWQQVGRVSLEAGRHRVELTSVALPDAPEGAAPRYAALILSADPTFQPPPGQVLDIYNALSLLAPRAGDTLTGRVQLEATGAGNLTGAEFSLDGELLRRVAGPPFMLALTTAHIANGSHTLRVEAVDRAGATGLAIEIPVVVAN